VIFDLARITQLVGNVARADESIAFLENKAFASNDHLQFSGEDIPCLILTRVRMAGYPHPRPEPYLPEAVSSSRTCARQTNGTQAHVKEIPMGSWLMFN